MRSTLIVNPVASGVTPALTEAVASELSRPGPVEVVLSERREHARELAAAVAADCAALYVLAGDGGYNEAVNGIRAGLAIGFIPGGATSVLPRALGLPRDPVACARHLAASTERRTISLGRANGRRFTFCAGLGLDAELVRAVDARGRTNGRRAGDLAFVGELLGLLWRRREGIEPRVEIEGHGRCAFAVAANCDPYTYAGPFAVHAAPRARFELGIDVVGVRRFRPRDAAQLAWWLLASPRHEGHRNVIALHDVDRVSLACDEPLPLQVDGEDLGDTSALLLESERNALTVIV